MVEIKICGVMDEAIANVAIESGATYVGIVAGAPDSPRHVNMATASGLIRFLRGKISSVLVTRVLTKEFIDLAKVAKPDFVQFHEPIPKDLVDELRRVYDGRIIFGISPRSTPGSIASNIHVFGSKDMVLIDGSQGSGTCIDDHELVAVIDIAKQALGLSMKDMLVAGGFSPSNVGAFLGRHAPRGVDASSGLETSPGVKDPALIKKFCIEVKKAKISCDKT